MSYKLKNLINVSFTLYTLDLNNGIQQIFGFWVFRIKAEKIGVYIHHSIRLDELIKNMSFFNLKKLRFKSYGVAKLKNFIKFFFFNL